MQERPVHACWWSFLFLFFLREKEKRWRMRRTTNADAMGGIASVYCLTIRVLKYMNQISKIRYGKIPDRPSIYFPCLPQKN